MRPIKLTVKAFLLTILLFSCRCIVTAQVATGNTGSKGQEIKYLLPDSTVFNMQKLDSLKQIWGRVLFVHDKKDDVNGIVHLMKMNSEIARQLEEENVKREKAMSAMLNKPSPDFELSDLHGKTWSLSKLRGKIVVLNFWFTACAPCVQEIPELNGLVRQYENRDIVFLALSFNHADQIEAFVKKHSFDYVLLPNSAAVDKEFHVSLWPTSIVIGKDGYIKLVANSSPQIKEDLQSVIDSLL